MTRVINKEFFGLLGFRYALHGPYPKRCTLRLFWEYNVHQAKFENPAVQGCSAAAHPGCTGTVSVQDTQASAQWHLLC